MSVYFHSMAWGFWFPKGQDDKIIDDPGKMAAAAQTRNLNVRRNTATWFRPLERFDRVTGHGERFARSGRLGYYVDKGWCVCSGFLFVRQGKPIERDVNLFPTTMIRTEDFWTLCGTILSRKISPGSYEVLIPQDIDEEAVIFLVDVPRFSGPQRGREKHLVTQPSKMPVLARAEVHG